MLESACADIVQLKKDHDAAVLEAANANEKKEKAAEKQTKKGQADDIADLRVDIAVAQAKQILIQTQRIVDSMLECLHAGFRADIAAAQAKQAETQRMLDSARADIVQLQRDQLVERTGAAMAHAVLGNQIATLQGQVAELTTTTVFNVETEQDERVVLGAAKLISDRKRQRAETPDSAREAAAYRIETGNAVKKIKSERDTATLSSVSALRRLETVQQKAAATHAACEQAKEDLEDAQDMNQDMINFDAQQKVLVDKLKAQVQGLGGNPVC